MTMGRIYNTTANMWWKRPLGTGVTADREEAAIVSEEFHLENERRIRRSRPNHTFTQVFQPVDDEDPEEVLP